MISNDIKKKIIEQTSIVEVVGEVVSLSKKGTSFFGLCPFHNDNHPSMSVNEQKKMFNCFSCNTKGNVIFFYSKFHHVSMDQAAIILAKKAGIQISQKDLGDFTKNSRLYDVMNESCNFYSFYLLNTEEGKKGLEYLHKRNIPDDLIEKLRLGLSPYKRDYLHTALSNKKFSDIDQLELGLVHTNDKHEFYDVFNQRIMFPIINVQNQVIGFSGRIYDKKDTSKYINSSESSIFHKGDVLWNIQNAYNPAKEKDLIYIFEGFLDVISAMKAGITNVVAAMGTALTLNHAKILKNITTNIVLCFDGDEAGILAMKHSTQVLAQFQIVPGAILIPEDLDPDDYGVKYGLLALKDYLTNHVDTVYNVLYDLAKKDLLKVDLTSVEKFKNSVFEFIALSNQATIVDYYLKKIAVDIDVSYDQLSKDYNNSSYSKQKNYNKSDDFSNYDDGYLPIEEFDSKTQPNVNRTSNISETRNHSIKKVKVTKNVLLAQNIILKHMLTHRNQSCKYLEDIIDKGYERDLMVIPEVVSGLSLANAILVYYQQNIPKESVSTEEFISLYKDNTLILDKYQEVMALKAYDCENEVELQDCIQTIVRHINKVRTRDLFIKATTSRSEEDVNKFVEDKSKIVKIDKE